MLQNKCVSGALLCMLSSFLLSLCGCLGALLARRQPLQISETREFWAEPRLLLCRSLCAACDHLAFQYGVHAFLLYDVWQFAIEYNWPQ